MVGSLLLAYNRRRSSARRAVATEAPSGSNVRRARPPLHQPGLAETLAANGLRLEEYREGRFSSSRWQAVSSDRRPRPLDLALRTGFAVYDLVPFRKEVMVVRTTTTEAT